MKNEKTNDFKKYGHFLTSLVTKPTDINDKDEEYEKIYYEKILVLIPECIDYKKYESVFFTPEKVDIVIKGFAESLARRVDYEFLRKEYESWEIEKKTNRNIIDYKKIIELLPSGINLKESILSQENIQKEKYIKINLEGLLVSLLESIDFDKLKKGYESDFVIPLEKVLNN